MLLVGGKVVVLEALLLHFLSRGDDVAADGISAHHDPVGWEEFLHAFVGYANAVGPFPEQFVRQSRESVLLLDEARYAEALCGHKKGSARVSPNSDGDVRFELLDYLFGFRYAGIHLEGDGCRIDHIAQIQLALKSHYGKTDDLVSGGGYFLHFHLAFSTDEKNLAFGVEGGELVGDRDGREDVSSRSASAYDYAQFSVFHCSSCFFSIIRRDSPLR